MLHAVKMKVARVLRTLADVATEPKFAVVRGELNDLRGQLRALHAVTEHAVRKLENERSEMEETRRMVGIACARIENFIKLQKEQHAAMEQSIATLLPLRALVAENA
jgi:hypothetical protein